MAFEDLKAAIIALMDEIAERPQDRHVLQERLREMLDKCDALGEPKPDDIKRAEALLSEEDGDDLFDDVPV